jgi:hypothetical protein
MKSFQGQFAGTFGPNDHLFDCVSASDCLLQTSEDMGRFLYELTPAADAQHCTEGDAESCAWLAASLLPFGPVGKLAKLGEVAKGAEVAAAAAEDGGLSADQLDRAFNYANSEAKLAHVLDPAKHGLADLVQAAGGRSEAMREIINSLGDGAGLPGQGPFEVSRVINDQTTTIRGAMVDGVPRIGTAFDLTAFPGAR